MEEVLQPPVLVDCMRVTISSDRLRALADFTERPPADSGFAPTVADMIAILNKQGIKYGLIDEGAMQDLLDSWLRPITGVVVAAGRPPTASRPETVTLQFDPTPGIQLAQREDGTVDFRELGIMQTAVVGQVLAVKTPSVPGEPGTDVRNRPVLPKMPKPVPMPAGKGTQVTDDGLALVAATDGQLFYGHDHRVTVAPILYVDGNVDFSTGNIDFLGSVVVKENVQSGFTVKADHNIEIYGIVEAANIIAGGDLIVRGGVQGSPRTRIEAQGNMRALYLQNATVDVGGDLVITDSVMHSTIKAKSMRVSGKRGLLVGGKTTVTDSLFARVIGSHLSTTTPIRVGYFPSAHERLRLIEQELAQLEVELEKHRAELLRLRVYGHGAATSQAAIREQILALESLVAELSARNETLLEERMTWDEVAAREAAFVQVGSVAYPGVRLEASVGTKHIEELARNCKYVLTPSGFARTTVEK